MSKSSPRYSDEKAWLRLVHTPGIGPKNAWKIYHRVQDSGLKMANLFGTDDSILPQYTGISSSLKSRLQKSSSFVAEERFNSLQKSSIRLLHPESVTFNVPEISGLPPALVLWGDLGLLNSPDIEVLMKSRDTSETVLKSFLYNMAQRKIAVKNWCFCPFSRLDWELVESLLKLGSGLVLGLVSGISRRALTMAHETPPGRMVVLAPEPPLSSRGAIFACIEAFHRLFSSFTQRIFLLQMRERGKTARRVSWAREMGCEITEFAAAKGAEEADQRPAPVKKLRKAADSSLVDLTDEEEEDDDDRFISCL